MTKNDLIAEFQNYDLYLGPKHRILKKYHEDQKATDRTYSLSILDFSNLMGQIRRYNKGRRQADDSDHSQKSQLQEQIESRFLIESNRV